MYTSKYIFIIAASLVLAIFYTLIQVNLKIKDNPNSEIPLSEGIKDDPHARAYQEFLMLRDPVTNKIPDGIHILEQEFAASLPKRIKNLNKNGTIDNLNSLTWTERGPNNVGGRTRALGIDIRTTTPPNVTIIAGGVSGGLYRSTNDGSSWTRTLSPSQLHNVSCLTQDTRSGKQDIWYAGTGELAGNSAGGGNAPFRGDGIYKSTDNGGSWDLLSSTSSGTPQYWDGDFDYVWNVAVDPSNTSQDEVYAVVIGGIKRSTDGGNTWQNSLGDYLNGDFADVAVTSTGVVYSAISSDGLSGFRGIRRSTDGITWTNITPAGFPTVYSRIVIEIAPSNQNIVYFLVEGANTTPNMNGHQLWKYTYLSGDGSGAGGSWENRGGNLPDETGGSAGNDPFDTQGGYDMTLQVSPTDPDFLIAGSTNLYRSTDGFSTTSNYKRIGGYAGPSDYSVYLNHHPDLHAGAFLLGSNTIYYSGNDGGVQRTNDINASTVSWTSLNNGYNVTQFYSISLAPESGSDVMMGGCQDNGTYYNTNPGLSSWVQRETGDGTIVEVAPLADDLLYTAYQLGGLRRRTRPGSFLADFTPTGSANHLFVNPLILDPNNSSLMYYAAGSSATTTKIWRCNPQTTTSASGWTQLSSTSITSDQISALGLSQTNNPNVLYFGTKLGVVKRVDNANSGSSPTTTTITTGLPAGYVSSIAVDPTNSNNALVVFSNYNLQSLWYTTNGGSSWTDVEGNLAGTSGPSVRWATIFYVSGVPHYFIATSVGIYFTTELNGSSTVWTQEAVTEIGNVVSVMIDWRNNDGTLAAATHGKGVFTTQITTPMPVELISFQGNYTNGAVQLNWETATELNNYGFEIERKDGRWKMEDGKWEKIGFVNGSGNSNSNNDYLFIDKNIFNGKYYYRLKQIDNDGQFQYSNIIEVDIDDIPEEFILEQNYPNPFNPFTKIRFAIEKTEQVKLIVYDALGNEVSRLFNNIAEAGITYEVDFNASRLSSGIYYYKLETADVVRVRKMILLK